MHKFDVLRDPVRRRILEVLADGDLDAGEITAAVGPEMGITQPAVSQHLRVLRESGFARVMSEGERRLYGLDAGPLHDVDGWLAKFRPHWAPRLSVMATGVVWEKLQRQRLG